MEQITRFINLITGLWREGTRRQMAGLETTDTRELELFEDELIWARRRLKDRNWQKLYYAMDLSG